MSECTFRLFLGLLGNISFVETPSLALCLPRGILGAPLKTDVSATCAQQIRSKYSSYLTGNLYLLISSFCEYRCMLQLSSVKWEHGLISKKLLIGSSPGWETQ